MSTETTTGLRYRPGNAVVVANAVVALVASAPGHPVVAALRDLERAHLDEVAALLSRAGTLPDLAVIVADGDGLVVLHHGDIRVGYDPGGPPTLERHPVLDGLGVAVVRTKGDQTCTLGGGEGPDLWLDRGVALASQLTLTSAATPAAPARTAPEVSEDRTIVRPSRSATPPGAELPPPAPPPTRPSAAAPPPPPPAPSSPGPVMDGLISVVPVAGTVTEPATDVSRHAAAHLETATSDHADDGDHTIVKPGRRTDAGLAPHLAARHAGTVQAVLCAGGHASPPNAAVCRVCSAPIVDRTTSSIRRPDLGTLEFTPGPTVSLEAPTVIGRTPPPGVMIDGETSVAVALDDPRLSRVHAVVHVVDWFVQISDQGTTNGTTVHLPGRSPQRLRPFEKVTILPGTVIDFGDAVRCTYQAARS